MIKYFLVIAIVLLSFGCGATNNNLYDQEYTINDERDHLRYKVRCKHGVCKAYDTRGRLKYIIEDDGKIYDNRYRRQGEIE
jgi:hypothetical protein